MNQDPAPDREHGRKRYEEFLLAEYEHIAEASFRRADTITEFFRHYLAIISLPAALVAAVAAFGKEGGVAILLGELGAVVPVVTTVICVAGLLVMAYVCGLRSAVLLYARTINGIRDYFTQLAALSTEQEDRYRVLPRDAHSPAFAERRAFVFVVCTFALIDSSYAGAGSYWWFCQLQWQHSWSWALLVFAASVALHALVYVVLAHLEEKKWASAGRGRARPSGNISGGPTSAAAPAEEQSC